MKKFNVKALPAAAFLLCLLALFAVGVRPFLVSAFVGSDYLHRIDSGIFKRTEDYFNLAVPTKITFLDVNGFIDRVTGKRMNGDDYYRLNNDALVYVMKKEDMTPFADAVAALKDYVDQNVGKPFLYAQFPFQVDQKDKQLPPGAEDYSNENADELLKKLQGKGVQTYDFRPFIQQQPDYYSQFYRTDHHWKAETGRRAGKEFFRYLAEQDPAFVMDERILDDNNYQTQTYDYFLGSCGRRFGYGYCGYEPFTTFMPNFETSLSVYDINGKLLSSGGAENTVLFPERLTYVNHYDCNMYSYYMDGDHGYRRYVNQSDNLNVVHKKLLVLKDSYANAFLPYLVFGFEEVTVVDLRLLETPLTDVIRQTKPDLTIVAYDPGVLTQSSWRIFDFFR